jgi:NAD(P)-dependent dehydrogenase (short-subunit alcohol dehydrogenase family)
MTKTILITGSTDGIGLETAKLLLEKGHKVLLHGRNPEKLEAVKVALSSLESVEGYVADLSDMDAVKSLAKAVIDQHAKLDVLINNAGVFHVPNAVTTEGLDMRFVVNTIAPYLLTTLLLPIMADDGRVINLSSAAQTAVDLNALMGKASELSPMSAYSQSKLAITMWTRAMAHSIGSKGPMIVAVNPGSLLGSKMVKEGFGVEGKDLGIGADILARAALSDEFIDATGKYFDNDSQRFANPHAAGMDMNKCNDIVGAIEKILGI